jgi:hypothetical protein
LAGRHRNGSAHWRIPNHADSQFDGTSRHIRYAIEAIPVGHRTDGGTDNTHLGTFDDAVRIGLTNSAFDRAHGGLLRAERESDGRGEQQTCCQLDPTPSDTLLHDYLSAKGRKNRSPSG